MADIQPAKDFSRAICDLFDILADKATTSTQRANIDRTRRLYSVYKQEEGTESIVASLLPHLIAKKQAIFAKDATEMMSAETRAKLIETKPKEVVISLYDFCVNCYKECTQEEKDAVWAVIFAMYKACLECAVAWKLSV